MKYLVTPAPHRCSRISSNDMYFYTAIALITCYIYGVIVYGYSTLFMLIASVGTAVISELLISLIKYKKFVLTEYSCLVTGLMIACIMPVNSAWYLGIMASALAIFIKTLFGGLGNNIFNPAALSRCILGCVFAGLNFTLFGEKNTILQLVFSGNKANINLADSLLGNVGGAIGTTCILFIILTAIILMIFKIIRWENLLFAVIGYIAIVWPMMGMGYILPMLLSASFIFVTVFMLNDPTTSPHTFTARCVYALIFGAVSALMLINNIMGESAVFLALLICNFLAPALDSLLSVFKKGVKRND